MKFYDFDEKFPYIATVYADNRFEAARIYANDVCREPQRTFPLPEETDIDKVYLAMRNADIGLGDEEESWDEYLLRIIASDKPQIVLLDMRLLEKSA